QTCPSPASRLSKAAASLTAGGSFCATIRANWTSSGRSRRCSTAASSSCSKVMRPPPEFLRQKADPDRQSAVAPAGW
ncbi:TPA: hypothetical protein MIQ60_28875, partial [Klebsiella pneumoniae]|nr:hypothetical protein [Klebsiella pneumoniae]